MPASTVSSNASDPPPRDSPIELDDELSKKLADDFKQSPLAMVNERAWENVITKLDNRKNTDWVGSGGEPATFDIIGMIAPIREGTKISARGNKQEDDDVIDDTATVKWQILLKEPPGGSDLSGVFQDQLAFLDREFMINEGGEDRVAENERRGIRMKSFLRSLIFDGPLDSLLCTTRQIYTSVKIGQTYLSPSRRLPPRTRTGTGPTSPTKAPAPIQPEDPSDSSEISLDSTYDPKIFQDHTGPAFRHQSARLYQLDLRDINGRLVHPLLTRHVFRQGTIVKMNVSLKMWNIKNTSPSQESHVYQVLCNNMQVLHESTSPAELFMIHGRNDPVVPLTSLPTSSRKRPHSGDSEIETQASTSTHTSPKKKKKGRA